MCCHCFPLVAGCGQEREAEVQRLVAEIVAVGQRHQRELEIVIAAQERGGKHSQSKHKHILHKHTEWLIVILIPAHGELQCFMFVSQLSATTPDSIYTQHTLIR